MAVLSPVPTIYRHLTTVVTGRATGSAVRGIGNSYLMTSSGRSSLPCCWQPLPGGAQWSCKRILVHCNNLALVDVWQSGTIKHTALMHLVRSLFFMAATHNYTVLLKHIPGVDNSIADSLSRSQLHRFRLLAPGADAHATTTPVVRTYH